MSRSLSRLQRESGGESVIALVAEVLAVPVDEARGLLAAADGPDSVFAPGHVGIGVDGDG